MYVHSDSPLRYLTHRYPQPTYCNGRLRALVPVVTTFGHLSGSRLSTSNAASALSRSGLEASSMTRAKAVPASTSGSTVPSGSSVAGPSRRSPKKRMSLSSKVVRRSPKKSTRPGSKINPSDSMKGLRSRISSIQQRRVRCCCLFIVALY